MVFTDSGAKTVHPVSRSEPLRDMPPIMSSQADYVRYQALKSLLRQAEGMTDFERFELTVTRVWDGDLRTATALVEAYPQLAKYVHPITERTLLFEAAVNSGGLKEHTAKLIMMLIRAHPDRFMCFPAPENGTGPYFRTVLGEVAEKGMPSESELLMSQGFDPRYGDTHGNKCSDIAGAQNLHAWRNQAPLEAEYARILHVEEPGNVDLLEREIGVEVLRHRFDADASALSPEEAARYERLMAAFSVEERERDSDDADAAPPFVNPYVNQKSRINPRRALSLQRLLHLQGRTLD